MDGLTREAPTDAARPALRPRPVGRPPDREADRRILEAAMDVYASGGWHGYNLTQVAKRARVGKALLYSRWEKKEDLLVAAFKALTDPPLPDFGVDVRTLLIAEGVARLASYTGPYGPAVLRLCGEARAIDDPILTAVHERVFRAPSARLTAELRSRRSSGDFPEFLSATLFLDAFEGALLMHTILTPRERLPRLRSEAEHLVARLVDQQLRAFGE